MPKDYLEHAHGSDKELKVMKNFVDRVDQFNRLADSFKHLGDVNRVRIFWMLTHTELCTACIAQMLDMSSPAVAHHLKLLRESGLIVG
ncbi:MAG: metalloregulator ArsR/SmtB family transcription factor, partial [Phoenicibacter congonensis]|nr:metalloregulator ArsR/SmtB family transcription factor [Phoenicibacter congonensis]